MVKKLYILFTIFFYLPLYAKDSFTSLASVSFIDKVLTPYGLSVMKISIIIALFLVIYFIRKVIFDLIQSNISKVKSLKSYSKDILNSIRKSSEVMMILINIELTLYVYNDFSSIEDFGTYFNIAYSFVLTFIVFRVINTISNIKLESINAKEKKIKNEVINVGVRILNILIWIIGSLIVLHLAGVELTAVVSGLGIGGLAVALAAKDSLANFFGTLSILFSDVFSQGDWIEVDGKEGTVVEIGLRVTKLRTFDNALIAIPNAVLANKDVRNWNKRSLGRRIKMNLGIKYNSKPQDIKNALSDIYKMLDQHQGIATQNTKFDHSMQERKKTRIVTSKDDEQGVKKTLLVYLDEFSGSSINILVYSFSKSVVWSEWLEVKQDVMFKIMEIFEKNSIEFAFPSMSLYHENELDLLDKK
ncbi:mechanosensitive ion channel family protein [Candidatus Sulfurimonas marisnigri]|uniref:Mechanosensitive ion channel family protein n=1 Tax=Candidatus Sulfurimonas marisnigri TaxID=2740405 RepID=A0A7S7LZ67_9BACT|nr:mechanosensitive ion channel family protein [Candidatus Sulfurimonas marisnigri]QOY54112.1 mechanosensitive ion channel family protein [Candidatus Sulfurimonas marisnigri]